MLNLFRNQFYNRLIVSSSAGLRYNISSFVSRHSCMCLPSSSSSKSAQIYRYGHRRYFSTENDQKDKKKQDEDDYKDLTWKKFLQDWLSRNRRFVEKSVRENKTPTYQDYLNEYKKEIGEDMKKFDYLYRKSFNKWIWTIGGFLGFYMVLQYFTRNRGGDDIRSGERAAYEKITGKNADVDDVALFVNTTWNEFLNEMLAKGEVEEIIVIPNHSNNTGVAIIRLHPGAIIRGHRPTHEGRIFRLALPNLETFEENLRKAEQSLGIPAEKRVSVVYHRADYLLPFILLGIFVLALIMLRRFRGTILPNFKMGLGGLDSFRKAKFRMIDPSIPSEIPKIKFSDVVGLHEAKIEVKEVVDYLRIPENYTRLGAKLPKGALLLGPPGCGKTLLAKAVASEANVPFLATNGTEFVEMIGGLGAARVRNLFEEAKRRAPSIIYIDEIDAVGRKRSGEGGFGRSHSEVEHTLNQLLVEMDGMDSSKGVVIIASTNRADILDKALLRPGRFDRHISIDLPTLIERKEIFEYYLGKVKIEKSPSDYSSTLSQMTPGFTGADIANVCNEAAIRAATAERSHVTDIDLQQALDRVLTGPEKRSTTVSPQEKEIVAYHESGHALIGWLLKNTDALLKVTIIPRTVAALGFAQYKPQDRKLYSQEELFDRMCMLLGGRAAENIVFKRVTTGAENDLTKVTKIAYDQVKNYGMSVAVGPISFAPMPNSGEYVFRKPYGKNLASLIDREANAVVFRAYKETEKVLTENRDKLDLLAKALLKKETLSYQDVKDLLGPPPHGEKKVVQNVELELPSPIDSDILPPPVPNEENRSEKSKQSSRDSNEE